MGLDVYLDGEVYFSNISEEERRTKPVQHTYLLGRWWKCHRLHDHIVDELADGELRNQQLEMSADELQRLLDTVRKNISSADLRSIFIRSKEDKLLKAEVINALVYALDWLKAEQTDTWRLIRYRASW